MSLTTGRGPLSAQRAGAFSAPVPADIVYVEPVERRIRIVRRGRTVVDTAEAVLVHRPGRPPSYAFPAMDITDAATAPHPDAPAHVRVNADPADEWWEEEDRLQGHPTNPYHRIDIRASARSLRVTVEGLVLVDATRSIALFETAHPLRLYVPKAAVRMASLRASSTVTHCPYKGFASYWSAVHDGGVVEDVAWCYEDPLPESLPIAGLLSFDPARADVVAGSSR